MEEVIDKRSRHAVHRNQMQKLRDKICRPAAFTILGAAMVIGSIAEIISIKSGRKALKYEKLRKESEERLSDKSYAYILQSLGYQVPEKYL